MTNDEPDVGHDDAAAEHDELLRRSERIVVRREVMWLTLLGVVLIVIGGAGTWLSRWDTSQFQVVELYGDRVVSVNYPCNGDSRLEFEEFDDRVEIGLTQRQTTADDCLSVRCVELATALGDRQVINTGTGDEVAVFPSQEIGKCGGEFDR